MITPAAGPKSRIYREGYCDSNHHSQHVNRRGSVQNPLVVPFRTRHPDDAAQAVGSSLTFTPYREGA